MDVPLVVAATAVNDHGALQKPGELADLLALATARNVRLVLELGSDAGGTLWAWAQLGADTVAVSLPRGPYSTGRPCVPHGAQVIEGDSRYLSTWLAVRAALDGRQADMLFVDADHTREAAAADVMAYSAFVRPGGLVALHDICQQAGRPQVDVWRTWQQLAGVAGAREFVHEPATWGGIGVIEV